MLIGGTDGTESINHSINQSRSTRACSLSTEYSVPVWQRRGDETNIPAPASRAPAFSPRRKANLLCSLSFVVARPIHGRHTYTADLPLFRRELEPSPTNGNCFLAFFSCPHAPAQPHPRPPHSAGRFSQKNSVFPGEPVSASSIAVRASRIVQHSSPPSPLGTTPQEHLLHSTDAH